MHFAKQCQPHFVAMKGLTKLLSNREVHFNVGRLSAKFEAHPPNRSRVITQNLIFDVPSPKNDFKLCATLSRHYLQALIQIRKMTVSPAIFD